MISGFCRCVSEIFTLLRCYTVYIGIFIDVSKPPTGPIFKHSPRSILLELSDPQRWNWQVVPENWCITTNLDCVTSQKS